MIRKLRIRRCEIVHNSLAVLFIIVWAFPIYWMLNTALKPASDTFALTPKFLPTPLTLDNFTRALAQPNFWRYLGNSLGVAFAVVLASAILAFGAAYAIARFRFYGRKPLLAAVIIVQAIPHSALIIPVFILLKEVPGLGISLLDNFGGLVLTYVSFVLPFTIWTLIGFVRSIPKELEEAASIDGATRFQVFRYIILPLLFPGLIATSIFGFLQAWNDYLYALIIMQDGSNYTLPVWLVSFSSINGTDYSALMAGVTIFCVPVIILFMAVQTRLTGGLMQGGVKG
jgi:N,N'-diacetylchitobiose transport system permease protein